MTYMYASKDGPLQVMNNITFRPFFFSLRQIALVSYLFLSRSEVVHPPRARVLYIMIVFMFINRQLFISRDIQSCDCIFGFLPKE